jgi:hypothetical protein
MRGKPDAATFKIPDFYPKEVREGIEEWLLHTPLLSKRAIGAMERMLRDTSGMQKVFDCLKKAMPEAENHDTDAAYFVYSAWRCASEDYADLRSKKKDADILLSEISQKSEELANALSDLQLTGFMPAPELSDIADLLRSSLPTTEPARGKWKSLSNLAFGKHADPGEADALKHVAYVWESAPSLIDLLKQVSFLAKSDGVGNYPELMAAISSRKRSEKMEYLRALWAVLGEAGFPIGEPSLNLACAESANILLDLVVYDQEATTDDVRTAFGLKKAKNKS